MRPLPVRGEQNQACGINIQPPGDMKIAALVGGQQAEHGQVVTVCCCADDARWLVEHQITFAGQRQRLPLKRDVLPCDQVTCSLSA